MVGRGGRLGWCFGRPCRRVDALAGGPPPGLSLPEPGAKRPRRRRAGGASAHIIQNLPLVLNSHPYWCPSCSLYPVG